MDTLEHPGLEIRDITPLLAAGARAKVSVKICRGGGVSPGFYPGAHLGDCGELVPPQGVRLRSDDYVVVSVVPTARGTIDLLGLRVAVNNGSRHWHEETGSSARYIVH